jgi:hypothetical protein
LPIFEGMNTSALHHFLEQHGDDVAEAAWSTAIGTLERACTIAREGELGRWRLHPRGELRRLRANLAVGLMLARFACAIADDQDAVWRELMAPAREQARLARLERLRATNPALRRSAAQRPPEPV